MTQEPDAPLSDPVRPSSRTNLRLSETAGDRLVTIVAWVAGLATITVLAALVAGVVWWLQHTRFDIKQIEYEDQDLVEVVPPPRPSVPPGAPTVTSEDGRVITNATWIQAPRPEFPAKARRRGVENGRVQLDCKVSAEGRIETCVILSEDPADADLSAAAIDAAMRSRLNPRTIDGVATTSRIRFTTNFHLR